MTYAGFRWSDGVALSAPDLISVTGTIISVSLVTPGTTYISVVGTITSSGQKAGVRFTLIGVANQAPIVPVLSNQTISCNPGGFAFSIPTDPNGDTLTFSSQQSSLSPLPSFLTMSNNATHIIYTVNPAPSASLIGTSYTIVLVASDSVL